MIVRALYTLLLTLVAPFFLYGLYKKKPNKPFVGKRWKEHFGLSPRIENADNPVWIHAASVGEVLAITPFIKRLKAAHPQLDIVLTTTTPTGAKQAEGLSQWVTHRYCPLDFTFAQKRFLGRIQPSQLIIVETELWPNMLNCVAPRNIPIHLVNARLSEKSYRGYKKVLPLFKPMASAITQVICQYQSDRDRFAKLGVAQDKLRVSGSIKFDVSIEQKTLESAAKLRNQVSLERPVWIAASTHQGEDEIVLDAHKKVLATLPDALLILVPRHPERFSAVKSLSKQHFHSVARSEDEEIPTNAQVYIGDTMGEMLIMMGASDICFMGGSLLGKKVGGHNLLEPAALGLPILTGPSFFNFADITQALCEEEACKIAEDSEMIATYVTSLMSNPAKSKLLGLKAKQVVDSNRGALDKTLAYLNY